MLEGSAVLYSIFWWSVVHVQNIGEGGGGEGVDSFVLEVRSNIYFRVLLKLEWGAEVERLMSLIYVFVEVLG